MSVTRYFILAAAFLYVLIRAITVGVTYDEVWTINQFVKLPLKDILSFTPADANNHLLNTLFIKGCFYSLGNSLFVARLPNVLAFALYLYFAHRITKTLPQILGNCSLLVLVLNPFLLDFFGLARGYGLSMGFLMAALFYVLLYVDFGSWKALLKALLFGGLAVISNFVLLHFWVSTLAVIAVVSLLARRGKSVQALLMIAVFSFLLFKTIKVPLQKLRESGSLYYGGGEGFYTDTMQSLLTSSAYAHQPTPMLLFIGNGLLLLMVITILFSFFIRHKLNTPKTALFLISGLSVCSVVAQHYLLGTLYLIDRTALLFYPLLILCFCFAAVDTPKVFRYSALAIVVSVLSVNFLLHANFSKTLIWDFDSRTETMLNEVNRLGASQNRKVKLDYSWPFQNSVAYYLNKKSFPFIENTNNRAQRDSLNSRAEIYFYLARPMEKVWYFAASQKVLSCPRRTLRTFPSEQIFVFDLHRDSLKSN
ncbi:MAG: hypothetical protein U0T73_07870 [Chitinophagales bacterium]